MFTPDVITSENPKPHFNKMIFPNEWAADINLSSNESWPVVKTVKGFQFIVLFEKLRQKKSLTFYFLGFVS